MKLNFLRVKKKKAPESKDLFRNVRPHWRWFLVVLFALFAAVLIWALGFVGRLNELNPASPSLSGPGEESINREKLDQVLKYFEERAAKAAELKESPPAAADPAR